MYIEFVKPIVDSMPFAFVAKLSYNTFYLLGLDVFVLPTVITNNNIFSIFIANYTMYYTLQIRAYIHNKIIALRLMCQLFY